jgi:hypothetical protein
VARLIEKFSPQMKFAHVMAMREQGKLKVIKMFFTRESSFCHETPTFLLSTTATTFNDQPPRHKKNLLLLLILAPLY